MTTNRLLLCASSAVLLAVTAVVAGAQEMPGLQSPTPLAGQGMRPYWHVFAAYAIAIVLVIVWIASIARRLRDVEERLGG
jgi:uncharacterized membrane protein YhaH (DUF805 family)